MTDLILYSKPFDWNDNLSEEAIEDFETIRGKLTYCQHQSIGMALAKLELLEKQGCKVIDTSGSSSENPNKCDDAISRNKVLEGKVIHQSCDGVEIINSYAVPVEYIEQLPPVTPQPKTDWIPVSERLPELNRPLLVTAYHRVYYGHLISENGNYGYPVFRIHGLGDKNRDWVQETMSHGPYSLGRIDAWMYLNIPEPYKPQEGGDQE